MFLKRIVASICKDTIEDIVSKRLKDERSKIYESLRKDFIDTKWEFIASIFTCLIEDFKEQTDIKLTKTMIAAFRDLNRFGYKELHDNRAHIKQMVTKRR